MKKIALSIMFTCVFLLLLDYVSGVLENVGDYNYQMSVGFYEEPEDSLDMVYIGASPTYTSWIAPLAWDKYGIKSRTYGNDGQPLVAVESFLRLAHEKQPNAVYMICLNGLYGRNEYPVEQAHITIDTFPESLERCRLIEKLTDCFMYTTHEKAELYFNIIRYHSRWNQLNRVSFRKYFENYKSGFANIVFFDGHTDIGEFDYDETKESEVPLFVEESLQSLTKYCNSENLKVVFVVSAQKRDELIVGQLNTITKELESAGFPVINECKDFDEIGLDPHNDFYNANHTNIHGALKITDYLAKYYIEHYDTADKSETINKSWDEAYDSYCEAIRLYLSTEEMKWIQ